MSGVTLQVKLSTVAAVIDLVGNAARFIVVFAVTQMVHKWVELKMFRKGRVRIDGKRFLDPFWWLIFLCGILLTVLTFLSIFFIEPKRRLGGSRNAIVEQLVMCEIGTPGCQGRNVDFLNTTGSDFEKTVATWPVIGGLLNAEEIIENHVVTSIDCRVTKIKGPCDTELMKSVVDKYEEKNVLLTESNSNFRGRRLFKTSINTAKADSDKPSVRTRGLCIWDPTAGKLGEITECGAWFNQRDTKEVIVLRTRKTRDDCSRVGRTCVMSELLGSFPRRNAAILSNYEGLATMIKHTPGSDEFFDTVTEVLIAREMVLSRALWEIIYLRNSKVVPVVRTAIHGEINEDTLVTVRALVVLGLGAAMLLAGFVMLIFLYLTPCRRTSQFPLYDFNGVTNSLLRSVGKGEKSESGEEEKSMCYERSSIPLYLTVNTEREGHMESYRGSNDKGVPNINIVSAVRKYNVVYKRGLLHINKVNVKV